MSYSFSDLLNYFNSSSSNANAGSLAPYSPGDVNNVSWASQVPDSGYQDFANNFNMNNSLPPPPIVDLYGGGQMEEQADVPLESFSFPTNDISSLSPPLKRGQGAGIMETLRGILNPPGEVGDTLSLGRKGAVDRLLPPETSNLPSSLISFAKDDKGKTVVLFKGKPITGSGSSLSGVA